MPDIHSNKEIRMINKAILTGRLTDNVDLKTTTSGISVCQFTIANDIGYGEKKKTSFINIVAWRGTAEFISKHFAKGNLIAIIGTIQTRNYEDKNGNKRTAFEVVADEAQFIEPKAAQTNAPVSTGNDVEFEEVTDEVLPF
jgi:single-strand DNA-binding protein